MSNSASGAARSLVISTVIVLIEVIDQQSKTEHWWRSGVNLTNSRSFMMLNNPSHLEVKYGYTPDLPFVFDSIAPQVEKCVI